MAQPLQWKLHPSQVIVLLNHFLLNHLFNMKIFAVHSMKKMWGSVALGSFDGSHHLDPVPCGGQARKLCSTILWPGAGSSVKLPSSAKLKPGHWNKGVWIEEAHMYMGTESTCRFFSPCLPHQKDLQISVLYTSQQETLHNSDVICRQMKNSQLPRWSPDQLLNLPQDPHDFDRLRLDPALRVSWSDLGWYEGWAI